MIISEWCRISSTADCCSEYHSNTCVPQCKWNEMHRITTILASPECSPSKFMEYKINITDITIHDNRCYMYVTIIIIEIWCQIVATYYKLFWHLMWNPSYLLQVILTSDVKSYLHITSSFDIWWQILPTYYKFFWHLMPNPSYILQALLTSDVKSQLPITKSFDIWCQIVATYYKLFWHLLPNHSYLLQGLLRSDVKS